MSLFDLVTQQRIEQLTQSFINRLSNPILAYDQAIAALDNLVRREAFVMAFNDGFYFVGIALLVSGMTLLFCKKVKPSAGAAAH